MRTQIAPAESRIAEATELLRAGELVVFPTETVYGLGADARRDDAVGRIYEAKGRPAGNPLIVHVVNEAAAQGYAAKWPEFASQLAARFWPGPLTLIVPRGTDISRLVSAGRTTVALRCPDHPVAQELLKVFGGPIAAPSANRSGFTSPTTAQHVMAELSGRVPLILDGGPCAVGVESTVVDVTGEVPRVLRPGAVTVEMLREVVGSVDVPVMRMAQGAEAASPGTYDRHYAPRTPAYYFTIQEWSRCGPSVPKFVHMSSQGGRIVLITHDPRVSLAAPHEVILLPAEAAGYAQAMYASLRQADEVGASSVFILLPDTIEGLWAAVVDRLKRAALPVPISAGAGGR